jgi:hypothetical protein
VQLVCAGDSTGSVAFGAGFAPVGPMVSDPGQFTVLPTVRLKRPRPIANGGSDSGSLKALTYLDKVDLNLPDSGGEFKNKMRYK